MPAIRRLDFLTPGSFPLEDPATGFAQQIELFRYAESLGYQGGWVRQRHFESNTPAPLILLAGAATVTSGIELGSCVVPLALENLWTLAEQFLVLDALAPGRINVGISGGLPTHPEALGPLLAGDGWASRTQGVPRAIEFLDILAGRTAPAPIEIVSPNEGAVVARLQPQRPELWRQAWYGGVTPGSAIAAAQSGLAYTTAIMTRGRRDEAFFDVQQRIVEGYFTHYHGDRPPRFLLGRTLLPTDSATPEAARLYRERTDPRATASPADPQAIITIAAPDYVGSASEILTQLAADPIVDHVEELRVELPYGFSHEDNKQILHDIATYIAPELGWKPSRAGDTVTTSNP